MAEALQKALWFLNVQKSGPGVLGTYVQWRGDAHVMDAHIKLKPGDANGVDLSQAFIDKYRSILDPNGSGEVDLSGGFHDAGDYIKFGITTGYAAFTLAWSMVEYPESYRNTGLEDEALSLLRWVDDYFMKMTFFDANGDVIAFAHQVGDASDHSCGWMPPELRRIDFCPRKGYFATDENPAADVTSDAAAALALTSMLIRAKDPAYADKALKYAIALYKFAKKHPAAVGTAAGGLYSSEYAYDDLAWAAIWLYKATGDTKSYIDDILGPDGNGGGWLDGFPGLRTSCMVYTNTSCWFESHTYCWNSLRTGVFLKMAQIMRDVGHPYAEAMRKIAREDSMKWADGRVTQTPGGFSILNSWGSARYNSAAQFVALLYAKHFGDVDPDAAKAITAWAKKQIDYTLGKNPLGKSYIMGFTNKYANQPHHAAGHASIWGEPAVPVENRHIIWGALVSGPSGGDNHLDVRADFGSNEVTIDYNASLIAALAAHYELSGGGQCPLADFPPIEPEIDEYYTLSNINGAGGPGCHSQVRVTLMNETIHPPKYNQHLSVKYFFDISELLEKGGSLADVKVSLTYDNGQSFGEPTRLSQPKLCPLSNVTAYVELDFEGYQFWGRIVRIKAPRTFILDIGVADNSSCTWDPSNDWSYADLKPLAAGEADGPKTPHVPGYSAGTLVWGEEPPCFEKVIPGPEPGPEPPPPPPPEPPPPPPEPPPPEPPVVIVVPL